MKFILVFSLCSAITGYCQNPVVVQNKYNSWTDCVKGGAEITIITTENFKERFNKEKLYISYFCNENNINKTPT
jgi:hypothetical protein